MTVPVNNTASGTLYLVPCVLADGAEETIPEYVRRQVSSLNFFIVENERSARRFLRSIDYKTDFTEVTLVELDKHNPGEWNKEALAHLKSGKDAGLISEAGLPAIADPGNLYVRLAHEHNIPVKPLTGPSSLLLALMASGMNGQRFRFHGYIPVGKTERIKKLQEIERTAGKDDETQLFIEAPYRNQALLTDILESCQPQTLLCIAVDLTSATEMIKTQAIKEWKKNPPDINKRPAVFLLYK